MTDLRTRISNIIIEHEIFDEFKDGWECSCGDNRRFADHNFQSWDEHLADAVIRELEADYILVPKGHTIARIRSAEKLGLTGDGK